MPDAALHLRLEALRGAGREMEAEGLQSAYDEAGEPGMLRWYIERALPKAWRARREGRGGNRAENVALLLARLGEIDEACSWLEEAVQRHSVQHHFFKVHPWLDSLRSDPRYDEVLKTMNLAD